MWSTSWSAFPDQYPKAMVEPDKDESTGAIIPDGGTVMHCDTLEVNVDPVKLLDLPELPDLPGTGLPERERRKDTKLIEIAAFQYCLIGLTNKGHVLKMENLFTEDHAQIWHYVSESTRMIRHLLSTCDIQLPGYSEIDKIKRHPALRATTSDDGRRRLPQVELSSDTMLITHVGRVTSISSEPRG